MSLKIVLNRNILLELAGARSYARGEAYAAEGRVKGLREDGASIMAQVCGTQEYHVELWIEEGELAYSCNCPVGTDGACCKHCVAVGLTWLAQQVGQTRLVKAVTASPPVTLNDVRTYLLAMTPEALVELLMTQVQRDIDLREELLLRVARATERGINISTYREAIDRSLALDDYLDYDNTDTYASGVSRVLDSLEELLKAGYSEEALSLIEYAIPAMDMSAGMVDDSAGLVSMEIEHLQLLHHSACVAVQPDPKVLARQLFFWELQNEYVDFSGAADEYAEMLGEAGLAAYRKLAEAEWEEIPALAPGQSDAEPVRKQRRRITKVMESLAHVSGDVDALVAVKSRDLSHAYTFFQIAQLYQNAGRHDDALAWAERGLQAFPERTDSHLREWLVEEYHRRGRRDDAMALVWLAFTEQPALPAYKQLHDHASRIGQWPQWRERAWTLLHQRVAREQKSRSYAWAPLDRSEIVRILLWEGKEEDAWQEAVAGGCSSDLWLQLAALREAQHPEDALQVYLRQIKPTIDLTDNNAYQTAIGLLQKCRAIMIRLGMQDEFTRHIQALRVEYKRKRNFIKLLDAEKW